MSVFQGYKISLECSLLPCTKPTKALSLLLFSLNKTRKPNKKKHCRTWYESMLLPSVCRPMKNVTKIFW